MALRTVIRIVTRLNVGGPARHAMTLTARVDPRRFRSLLVTGQSDAREGDWGPRASAQGIRVIRIPQLRRSLHPVADLIALTQLMQLVWRERPVLIHTHMAKAGALGRLTGVLYNTIGPGRHGVAPARLVHTFHGHVLDGYFKLGVTKLFVIIERWLARRTDRLIAVSQTVRDQILAKGIGRPAQWRVIPLGLDLSPLAMLPLRPPQTAELTIGLVGRLVPIKNPSVFLEALATLRRQHPKSAVRGLIVGDGPLRPQLERQVIALGLQDIVQMTGWQEDLPTVYRNVDVTCLTSENEGTPVALIEAMAAGRAVVATQVGGVPDLLDGTAGSPLEIPVGGFRRVERGLLVKSNDVDGLANALWALTEDGTLRQQLGVAGRRYVAKRYTADRLVHELTALYDELIPVGGNG